MKKVFVLIANCILPTAYCCFAQMQPADSLPGTYAGQYWFKQPTTNPWTITPDTVYVTNIDSVNCAVQAHDVANFSLIPPSPPDTNYYTDYYSCNGSAPLNNYVKFYNSDSIRIISDNVPQPPPNPAYSMRFYGKRISNKTMGVEEFMKGEQIKVYPNPCSGVLNIESKTPDETEIKIMDGIGKEVKSQKSKVKSQITTIDINDLKKGIYFLQIKTPQRVLTKKIIIN